MSKLWGNANKQCFKMAGCKLPESAQLGETSPVQALLINDLGSRRPCLSPPRGLSVIYLQELWLVLVPLLRGDPRTPSWPGTPAPAAPSPPAAADARGAGVLRAQSASPGRQPHCSSNGGWRGKSGGRGVSAWPGKSGSLGRPQSARQDLSLQPCKGQPG